MTDTLIHAKGLQKRFGTQPVLRDINFDIKRGEIVGLIGQNGAGKTTLLKSILGLASCDGDLRVLGRNPVTDRVNLMKQVSFIADTATLPKWITVAGAIEFMHGVHPAFSREKALAFLDKTEIPLGKRVGKLSKGMITKAHLSLVLAIDSALLVLDEPTLGLDIIKRKDFYRQLLSDYFDHERTILVTTHQVEEIENLLTRAMFIQNGRIVLDDSLANMADRYVELQCSAEAEIKAAAALKPIFSSPTISGKSFIFRDVERQLLEPLGKIKQVSLADLFVATAQETIVQETIAQEN